VCGRKTDAVHDARGSDSGATSSASLLMQHFIAADYLTVTGGEATAMKSRNF
jgi:hypothetical protein